MSSTNKTEMGFNQWSLADKPTMEDFNADNALTEQLLGERYTKAEIDQKIRRADAVPTSLILNNYLYINQRGQSSYTITSDKWTCLLYTSIAREKGTVMGTQTFAERVNVSVIERDGATAAVSGGFSPEDEIIVSSARPVAEGDRVRTEEP